MSSRGTASAASRRWLAASHPDKSRRCSRTPGLRAWAIDGHRRQVLHLLPGEVEPDTGLDPGDRADGDGHFLPPQQVPLLQQHVSHLVVAGVYGKSLDQPDLAVGGEYVLAAAHLDLAQRHGVV